MNTTCGIDIIEIERVKGLVDSLNSEGLDKIFTKSEQAYCDSKRKMRYQHYAARFAAKEAIFKAISSRLKSKFEINWNECEVLNDKNGKPDVHFINKIPNGLETIDISLSHCKEFATACVITTWKYGG